MWFFRSAIQAALDLKRTCRWCGKEHFIGMRDKKKTIPCIRCGKRMAAKV